TMASINYDTRSGRFLALSDLFRPGCNYVSHTSEISHPRARAARVYRRKRHPEHAGPVEKNCQVFRLMDTELALHFQQYQMSPGAVPAEQVSISLSNLTHLLQNDYLAGQELLSRVQFATGARTESSGSKNSAKLEYKRVRCD